MARVNLTQRFIDTVKPPEKDSTSYQDTTVRGLTLRVRSNGLKTWVMRYRWEGVEHMVTLTGDEKLLGARLWGQSIRTDVSRGNPPHLKVIKDQTINKTTIEHVASDTLAYLESQGRSKSYVDACRRYQTKYVHPAIGHIEVHKVRRLDVERLLRPLVSQPATHNRVLAWISLMLTQARKWEMLTDAQWISDIGRQKEQPREAYLTDAQLDRLIDALTDTTTDYCVSFLMLTGARPNEAFKARWEQFDLNDAVWRKPAANMKTKKAHTVPLAPEAVELLRSLKEKGRSNEWVFPSPHPGRVGHLTTIKNRWATLRKVADLGDANLYDLRHTFATRLLSQGASIKTVQSLTGHSTPQTLLKHYAHVVNDDQRAAVAGLMGKRVLKSLS
ncbi:tyrosine-type recombinase/integrase [Azospirillum thermophilum]|nr:site-specific integrase [Azospirillum thermophilum]